MTFYAYIISQLRIIIRQEYCQEQKSRKDASHADNQELAEVFTPIHSLYPIPGICQKNEAWQMLEEAKEAPPEPTLFD